MPGEKQKDPMKKPGEWREPQPERKREEGVERERHEQGQTPRRSEETARKQ